MPKGRKSRDFPFQRPGRCRVVAGHEADGCRRMRERRCLAARTNCSASRGVPRPVFRAVGPGNGSGSRLGRWLVGGFSIRIRAMGNSMIMPAFSTTVQNHHKYMSPITQHFSILWKKRRVMIPFRSHRPVGVGPCSEAFLAPARRRSDAALPRRPPVTVPFAPAVAVRLDKKRASAHDDRRRSVSRAIGS